MFLAPSLTGTLIFYGIPFFDVARRSFCDAMGKRFVGLSVFWKLLGNQAFQLALYNTIRYELICLPLLLCLSLLMALLVWELKTVSGSVRALVLPLSLPAASMVLVWQIFLCREGVLDQLLGWLTGRVWERDWTDGPWAFGVLVATYLWKNAGYDMLLWLSGLRAIPDQLYEAAKIDGAGRREQFCYITMPCLKGTAGLVLMLSLASSFQVFREAFLLSGSYPHESIYLFQHLFNHWFVEMDVQKMCGAAFMMLMAGAAGYGAVLRCADWSRSAGPGKPRDRGHLGMSGWAKRRSIRWRG